MQNLLCPPSLKVYNEYLCFLYNPLFSFRLIHLTLSLSLSFSLFLTYYVSKDNDHRCLGQSCHNIEA